ncbi:MAG TPA: glutamate racemase [Eggerthellaceae bacterium]|nr:glutamate racemase [Eggerthellaceae bacterium]
MAPYGKGFVGVFDSGVGGISVLRELARQLPHEDFRYFGDSAFAPYGEKERDWVLRRSRDIVDDLLDQGAKAIVIACNTATSAAASTLRADYAHVPIIGVEPALKPATLAERSGRILVMATPITLRLDKYQQLAQRWGGGHEVIPVPCPGLAARIEQGNLDAPDLQDLLQSLVGAWAGTVDSVVLGCTHYPFIARQIRAVVGDVPLFDGARGTALQLKRKLAERSLLSFSREPGRVEFASSRQTPEEIALYRRFFEGRV